MRNSKFLLARWFFIAFFSLSGLVVFAQLKLSDFKKIKLGSAYTDAGAKQEILDMFTRDSTEYTVYKSDMFGKYKISLENTPFDFYGKADYTIRYVKDTLSNIEIEFSFPEYRLRDFKIFISQFISDLNTDFNNITPNVFNKANLDKIIKIAEKNCKASDNYLALPVHNFGRGEWAVNNPTKGFTSLFISISLTSGQRLFYSSESYSWEEKAIEYSGAWMSVKMNFINSETIRLYSLFIDSEKEGGYYKSIEKYYDKKLITWDSKGMPVKKKILQEIELHEEDGIYKLPVRLNGVLTLDFILDLGASDISMSQDVFLVLYKAGTVSESDFIGNESYRLADGSIVKSDVVNLKKITIGGKTIENVRASISKSTDSPLLLGQSALKKLSAYRIDVNKKVLIIE